VKRALLLAAILALPAVARAEGERAASASLGYASFTVPVKQMDNMEPVATSPDGGVSLSGSYERMIGTDFGLRGEAAFALFRGGNTMKQSPGSYAVLGDVGVVFRFDVVHWVPYAFGGIGAITSWGGPIDRDESLVLVVGGGLDYLVNRKRSLGGELRLASFGGDVTVFTIGLRGTMRWGFF
jgi:hypothetical protein